MAHFEARTVTEPGRVVVSLTGECDLAARERLTAALLAAVEQSPVVVADLSGLAFLDSSGVHALVVAHREAKRRGGRFAAVGATGVVAHVLDLTGMAELLRPADGA